jgi:hypothetical protein
MKNKKYHTVETVPKSNRKTNFDSFYNSLADSPNVNFEKDQKTLTTVIKMD